MRKLLSALTGFCFCIAAFSQDIQNNPGSNHGNKFEQLGTILPSPNEYRTASGAPGPHYWQQRADYNITCSLDEDKQILTGSETITYFNNSPDPLTYIWLQLDENQHSSINNSGYQTSSSINGNSVNARTIDALLLNKTDNGFGDNIVKITGAGGNFYNVIAKAIVGFIQ